MIAATCDVNVLASGFISPSGAPGRVLDAWRANRFTLVVSAELLGILQRTLAKPYFLNRFPPSVIARYVAAIQTHAVIVSLSQLATGVAPDAEDDLILATALSGRATYLVTGDRRFRDLGSYGPIRLLSPIEFLTILEAPLTESSN